MVNMVVEVEDPTAQITDLNISSLKESPNITGQSSFSIKGRYHEILCVLFPLRFAFLFEALPIKLVEIDGNRVQ